ncbi:MAG TPA: hypothetical protein VK206_19645 [Anaerolineales bacterium]|nr:hypothetical protein [Anaerolineales bacterium]
MLKALWARLPSMRNIVTVYAVAMFLVYTWTLYTSFWKLPSWLFFLNVGEIVSIYSYAFLVNFLESVLLLILVLLPAIIFPQRWWKDEFIAKAFVFMLIILGSAILHFSLYRTPDIRPLFVNGQLLWWIVTLLVAVLLTWLAGRVNWIRQGLENIADRFVVFLYVYLPLTGIAFLIVFVRIYL